MNRLMKVQVTNALMSLKALDNSIDFAAMQNDGVISPAEKKQIRKIRKAIRQFEKSMKSIM